MTICKGKWQANIENSERNQPYQASLRLKETSILGSKRTRNARLWTSTGSSLIRYWRWWLKRLHKQLISQKKTCLSLNCGLTARTSISWRRSALGLPRSGWKHSYESWRRILDGKKKKSDAMPLAGKREAVYTTKDDLINSCRDLMTWPLDSNRVIISADRPDAPESYRISFVQLASWCCWRRVRTSTGANGEYFPHDTMEENDFQITRPIYISASLAYKTLLRPAGDVRDGGATRNQNAAFTRHCRDTSMESDNAPNRELLVIK